MKKIIVYVLVGLTMGVTCFNTYKILTPENKVINNTIKESFDSSSLDEQISALKQENESLKEEISKMKQDIDNNKKVSTNNYDNEIKELKEKNQKLENFKDNILDCFFFKKGNFNLVSQGGASGGHVYINDKARCQKLFEETEHNW